MKTNPATNRARQVRKDERTSIEPFGADDARKTKREGPSTVGVTHEGPSTGRSGNSTATGAAGQLTPKDER